MGGAIKLMIRPETEMIYEQLPPSSSRLSSKFNRTFDGTAGQKAKNNPVINLAAKQSNLIKQLNQTMKTNK